MASRAVPDTHRETAMAPSEVRVTVFRLEAPQRQFPVPLRRLAVAMLAVAIAVIVAVNWSGGSRSVIWGVSRAGPAGVAAAYGYPPDCLHVRISAINPAFARADFTRPRSCRDEMAFPSGLFHRFGGEWHPVLYAVSYSCPVPSVPAGVQRQLALCPR